MVRFADIQMLREIEQISPGRKSPKKGNAYQAFIELYKIRPFLKDPNLRLRLDLIDMEEYRLLNGWSRDKKKGSDRFDRIPLTFVEEVRVDRREDYMQFIPYEIPEEFTAKDFAACAKVDYAILMTTKYKKLRYNGADKKEAIATALRSSIQSIIVSALSFFAATFGVGMYSNIDMISSLCILMARGAIISMFVVIFILPSMFMIFDKLICATSMGFRNKKGTTVNVSENNVSVQ